MREILEKDLKIYNKSPEAAKPVYSRELYEKILKLLADREKRIKTLGRRQQGYIKDKEKFEREFTDNTLMYRNLGLDIQDRQVKGGELNLEKVQDQASNYKEKLRVLYELAHEDALKVNQEIDAQKLQESYNRLSELEKQLEGRMDPDNIPTSQDIQALEEERDVVTKELLDGVAEFFKTHPQK